MLSSNKPLRIGITGGIGCGKSTVLALFEQLGVPCFVADKVAAEYYNDANFVDEVAQLLGSEVKRPDGTIDKAKVASIAFADKAKLAELNGLIHPRVHRDFDLWCSRQNSDYVLFESAILYESGFANGMDKIICVYLEKEERIRRLLLRDHVDRAALEARMSNQWSAEEKMEKADWVVLNYEGNPRRRQVEYIDIIIRNINEDI